MTRSQEACMNKTSSNKGGNEKVSGKIVLWANNRSLAPAKQVGDNTRKLKLGEDLYRTNLVSRG